MKQITMIIMIAAMAVCCGSGKKSEQTPQGPKGSITTVKLEKFTEIIRQEDVRLIDVRTPKEYAEGHIIEAENIDIKSEDFDERIKNIRGKVAVYCRSGRRSMAAAEKLAAQGCTVYNLDGGITAWQKAYKK